ncbi:MAG: DUF1178 family protein [Myxococcaceae bacterium]|nr:DUF1178 family protein [Myxococcaceae bacterium]MBH2006214.1 DUF1178 family protein [Myxococcaceae bacterium]
MYDLKLECEAGHRFEGLFDTEKDYIERLDQGEICCPVCDSEFVMRSQAVRSQSGRALMQLIQSLKSISDLKVDRAGDLFFKLLLD